MPLLNMVARDIRVETDLMCFCIHGFYHKRPFEMSAKESGYGLHGGETESSMILAIASELVQMDKATQQYPDFPDSDISPLSSSLGTPLSLDLPTTGAKQASMATPPLAAQKKIKP